MAENPENTFANIREILGFLLNETLVDITQHDKEEWVESREAYVVLHFSNGATLTIPITDQGFDYFDPRDPAEGGEGDGGAIVRGL